MLRHLLVSIAKALLGLIPRDSSIWVFGGSLGRKYGDNAMYFFRYCQRETTRKCIWLTRSDEVLAKLRGAGFRAYRANSLGGLYYGLRARWHIFDVCVDDTHRITAQGALLLNLWHGIPLKDIRRIKGNTVGNLGSGPLARFILRHRHPVERTYLVHPNRFQIPELLDTFFLRAENVILANLPRNVVFEAGFRAREYWLEETMGEIDRLKERLSPFRKVIGYFPTWRDQGQDLFLGMRTPEELRQLDDFLRAHGIVLITKWHGCSFAQYQHAGASQTAESIDAILGQCASIVSLPFHTDLNSVLPQVDLLITDYSSVLFDFLLSNRPQLFYPYDLEDYRKAWGFLLPYEQTMPGTIVRSGEALHEELKAFIEDPAGYAERGQSARERLRTLVFETPEGSARIVACMGEITSTR